MIQKPFKLSFLIVGAAKSGTTTIHQILSNNMQFSCPVIKETGFWSDLAEKYNNCEILGHIHKNQVASYKIYKSLFQIDKLCIEASPDYLAHSSYVISKLKKFDQKPTIIIILRNPLYRAFSHYKHFVRDGIIKDISFIDSINHIYNSKNSWSLNILENSKYFKNVRNFLQSGFEVKIYKYEDIFYSNENTINFFNESFKAEINNKDLVNSNRSFIPKYKSLDNLKNFIQPIKKHIPYKSILKRLYMKFNQLPYDLEIDEYNFVYKMFEEDQKKLKKLFFENDININLNYEYQ